MPTAKVADDKSSGVVDRVVMASGVGRLRSELTGAQVKIRTSKRFKMIVVSVAFFAALVDFMGTVVVLPMLPSLCLLAPGGPFEPDILLASVNYSCSSASTLAGTCAAEKTATYDAIMASPAVTDVLNPHAFTDYPFGGLSSSIEIPMAVGQYMSAIGSFTIGNIVDKIGAKGPMLICLTVGIGGYMCIYAAGIWVGSYWLFAIGLWINNLFGVVTDITTVYMAQLFANEPDERDKWVGAVQGVVMLGASIGAVVVMPFAQGNGEYVFNAIWVSVGLTVLAICLVMCILVTPPKDQNQEKKVIHPTPKVAKRLLITTCIASCFDTGGDTGTQMARSTILSNLFPDLGTTSVQNILLLVVIAVFIGAFTILFMLRKIGFNLAAIASLGALATLITQVLLALNNWDKVGYLVLWHAGKVFGFLSTVASGLMIASIAPPDRMGFWNGLNMGLSQAVAATSQIIFSRVYDMNNDGTPEGRRGMNMLLATSGISLICFLVYVPLIPLWPRQEDETKKKKNDEEYQNFAKYEAMPYEEWANLPMETGFKVSEAMLKAGKQPRSVTWGKYADERKYLVDMSKRAPADFQFIRNEIQTSLTDRAKMVEMQKMQAEMDKGEKPERDSAKLEMGAWMADYFDDAGYQDWEKMAPLYKSMLMSAFPPLDPLDDAKPDYVNMPIDQFEDVMLKWLSVMDEHLSVEKGRYRGKVFDISGLFQRR